MQPQPLSLQKMIPQQLLLEKSVLCCVRLSLLRYRNYDLKDLSAKAFYELVDLEELKEYPGIGPKSIGIIKQIYRFYGLSTD